MSTRLYFSYSIGSVVNPAYDAAWEITSTALTRSMLLTKSPDGAFGTNSGQAMALDEDILICQAISDPLDGAQTVGGVGATVEGFVQGESVNWDSMFPYISIRVVSEDGTVVRGTLFVGPGHAGNPWPTGGSSEARQIMDTGLAVASVAASDRDRIVVEFGADPDVGAGVGPPYDIELTFGRPDVSDITVEGDVGKVPWIEFSQTLKFVSPSTYDSVLLYSIDSELVLGGTISRTPVTYGGVLLDPSGLLTGSWIADPSPQTFAGVLLDPSGLMTGPIAPASTAYTETVSDTIVLTDTIATIHGHLQAVSDTIGLVDSISSVYGHIQAVSDTVGLTDTVSMARGISVSDTIVLADAVIIPTTYTETVSDSIGLLDTVSVTERQFRASLTSDTLRGGAVIIFSSTRNLSDKSLDQTLLSTALPAGWVESTAGGGSVLPQSKGLVLRTSNDPLSIAVAGVQNWSNYFDVQVTASIETLAGTIPTVPSTVGFGPNYSSLLVMTGTAYWLYAGIQHIRGAFYAVTAICGPGSPVPTPGNVAKGSSIFLGTKISDTANTNLRVICGYDRAWLSAGSMPMISMKIPGMVGVLRDVQLRTNNDSTTGGIIATRYTNFQVRSQALIADRFIDNPTYDQSHEIVGNVPAAMTNNLFDFDDLGAVDIETFGPWGRTLLPNTFEYTKPIMKTLGGGVGASAATLNLITDPIIRSDQ